MFNHDHNQPVEDLAEIYTQVLLDSAHHPQAKVELDKADKKTSLRNASCGDEVSVELKLSQDGTKILAVGWQGEGCIISQAHMDGLALAMTDQEVKTILTWGQTEVLGLFGLPSVSPGRLKCLMLGLTAVQQALTK